MLAVAERTDHPRRVNDRAVRSQQKPALGWRRQVVLDLSYPNGYIQK